MTKSRLFLVVIGVAVVGGSTSRLQGSNLPDGSGQTGVLREQPGHLAPVADVVKNQDVISLVQAGLDDEIVIAKIASSKCQFDRSPEALIQLRQSGVSAAVVEAMVGAGIPPATSSGDTSSLPSTARRLGERNYFEFKLGKTKAPQRVGDITLLLKGTDPKKNKYTIEVNADDEVTEKKDKNVNEPVQVYTSTARQPYEIVVYQVHKDLIVGYLAVPKERIYKDVTPNPPAPTPSIEPSAEPRLKQLNKTTADLTPVKHIYNEIKLGKTKQPQRFGDIALMLRKSDPDKQVYSVEVMADDKVTLKQNKNVNEVVQFHTIKGGRTPYNLLINQVTKDGIVGYLWREPVVSTPNPSAPGPTIQPSVGPALVTGRVVWNGIPVPNVGVELKQVGDYNSLSVLASVVSAADGTFTIQEPPTGSLMIYVLPPGTDYWGQFGYPVTIMAGQPKNVGDLAIAKKLQLLSPANFRPNGAKVTTTTPTLQWTAFHGAARYTVYVSNNTTHQRVFFQSTQSTQIAVSPALQSGQQYQWGVDAYNSNRQDIAYSVWYFTVQ